MRLVTISLLAATLLLGAVTLHQAPGLDDSLGQTPLPSPQVLSVDVPVDTDELVGDVAFEHIAGYTVLMADLAIPFLNTWMGSDR